MSEQYVTPRDAANLEEINGARLHMAFVAGHMLIDASAETKPADILSNAYQDALAEVGEVDPTLQTSYDLAHRILQTRVEVPVNKAWATFQAVMNTQKRRRLLRKGPFAGGAALPNTPKDVLDRVLAYPVVSQELEIKPF